MEQTRVRNRYTHICIYIYTTIYSTEAPTRSSSKKITSINKRHWSNHACENKHTQQQKQRYLFCTVYKNINNLKYIIDLNIKAKIKSLEQKDKRL